MKRISLLIIALLLINPYGCERDDICPETTPTTPRLIIELRDLANQDDLKNVFDFRAQGVDNNQVLPDYNVVGATSKLILPLRTDTNTTQYKLHINYALNNNGTPDISGDDFEEGNEDIITLNYTTEQIYVSRACGYKTVFKNLTLTIKQDTNNWILSKEIIIENNSVEDETNAHFYLFH